MTQNGLRFLLVLQTEIIHNAYHPTGLATTPGNSVSMATKGDSRTRWQTSRNSSTRLTAHTSLISVRLLSSFNRTLSLRPFVFEVS